MKLPDKYKQILNNCVQCDISLHRRNVVFGDGNINSKIIFIGEAPGANEDKQGIPFIGNAGKILNGSLTRIGLDRSKVFLTNVIKCRTAFNRTPSKTEICNCSMFLQVELYVAKPKIVILMGNTALRTFYGNDGLNIGLYRGVPTLIRGMIVLPIYHPSYIVRNLQDKEIINNWKNDFYMIAKLYKGNIDFLHKY